MIINIITCFKALSSNKKIRLCFFVVIVFSSCSRNKNVSVLSSTQDLEKEVESLLPTFLTKDSMLTIDSVNLTCYSYFRSQYEQHPLWFKQSQLNKQGESLWKIIQTSEAYGLIPESYHLNDIKNHLDSIHHTKNVINVTSLLKADLLLSDAYFLMGAHLNKGRFYPDSLCLHTHFSKLRNGWDSILKAGYQHQTVQAALDTLEPACKPYQFLKKELGKILKNNALFSFDSIPFIGVKDSVIKTLIVKNLMKQGFYDTLSSFGDSVKFARALMLLQQKWFIQPDGKMGKYTQQALTYHREKIIHQISMSMERWRWEDEFPERYAFINIPSFNLTVYEHDTLVMQSAVVCGKPETPTPVLSSKIDHMLIYPYWNVPYSIASKEILPAVQKDIHYLTKKNFEVLGKQNQVLDYTTLPWKTYSKNYLPIKFRQRIGNENSLGIVKFHFHNPYGVYLHDTNSKRYFKTKSRAQSHGCIRLEDYGRFADFLIRDDSLHYTHDSLRFYFIKEEQRKLSLKKPLAIYIRYYTAEASKEELQLYLDIYGKDEQMVKLLYKQKTSR